MIFRQMFDSTSGTYSYLLASRRGGEALIIDPVLEKVDRYLQLLRELDLKLVKAVDTHLHADHITGLGALRDRTHCITVMGEQSGVDVVSMRVTEGDKVEIEGVALDVLYTPGHTDDSYSFLLPDRVFTGVARARGALAKNDRLDARLIAEYVATMPTHVVRGDPAAAENTAEIVTMRRQLCDEHVAIENQAAQLEDAMLRRLAKRRLGADQTDPGSRLLEKRLTETIAAEADLAQHTRA